MEFPDFREHMARYQRDSQSCREASHAVRAKARGKSRQEIRDLYEAELRSRGLPIPSEEVLAANVDAITGNYLPGARLLGRSLADIAKLVGGIIRPPR